MTLAVSITVQQLVQRIAGYLTDATNGILPALTPVLPGPINRAAQPAVDHLIMTPIHRRRLRTNVEVDVDPFPTPGGFTAIETGTAVTFQMDFYGASAAEWAAALVAVWRSEYAVRGLAPECAPLYADEGRMIPLVTGEEQYLTRWTLSAVVQYNPVTAQPQQFADTAEVTVINVDERYPP